MIHLIRDRLYADLEILYNFGFPVEDLGAPPDRGFGALGPSENTPNFLKRRYAAQKFFFARGRAKKISPVREKMGSNRARTRFQLILAPF